LRKVEKKRERDCVLQVKRRREKEKENKNRNANVLKRERVQSKLSEILLYIRFYSLMIRYE